MKLPCKQGKVKERRKKKTAAVTPLLCQELQKGNTATMERMNALKSLQAVALWFNDFHTHTLGSKHFSIMILATYILCSILGGGIK